MRQTLPRLLPLLCAAGLLTHAAGAAPPGANPVYRQQGYWDAPLNVRMIAIHSVLTRGYGSSHSQVIFWGDGTDVRLWHWDPLAELTNENQLLHYPTSSDIFCAGHSVLADGRILVTGGSEVAPGDFHGLDHVNIFNPATHVWREPRPPNMSYPRWYPTNTALGDGRVLVTAGLMYKEMGVFGGAAGGSSTTNFTAIGLRDTPILLGSPVTGSPAARHDHSLVFDETAGNTSPNGFRDTQRMLLFGGETDAGTPLNDLWALSRDEYDVRVWTQLTPAPDPVFGLPPARSQHQAVYSAADSSMIVLGGRGVGGVALGDVWALHLPGNGATGLRWKKLLPTGGGPELARWGHSAVIDSTGHTAPRRILLFGGRNGQTFYNDLWALNLVGAPSWKPLMPEGGMPSRRAGQVAIFDPDHERHSLVLFGGGRTDSLFNDVWSCSFQEMSDTMLVWRQIFSSNSYNTTLPTPRTRAAALYDAQWDRMILVGGDGNGDLPGGELGDVWTLGLDFFTVTDPDFGRRRHVPQIEEGGREAPRGQLTPAMQGHGDNLPRLHGRWEKQAFTLPGGPRAGLAVAYDPRWLHAHYPEVYDPVADSWQVLTTASLWQIPYPDMFLLPSGRLLFAGPSIPTYLLDLNGPAHWVTPSWSQSPFVGGTAVQYRPGKVLKTGSESFVGTTEGAAIDLSVDENAAAWQTIAPMAQPRVKHNMVLLPDGDVFVTGGVQVETNPATAVKAPQIWHPASGAWSAPLAPEGSARDYHSTAILLPDGRIFCGGGDRQLTDRLTVTVYWPPYLFLANGSLAPRPVIAAVDTTLDYGQSFVLTTPQAAGIASVSLIRPAAVTHQFDQDQRYVPLSFALNGAGTLQVAAPAQPNLAPPGNYLLFIVDSQGVPAVARWVYLGSTGVSNEGSPEPPPLGTWARWSANPVVGPPAVTFALERDARTTLDFFDAQGRLVRRLVDAELPAGQRQLVWDRRDDAARPVRPGVYFYRLRAGAREASGRLVLLGR